MTKQKSDPAKVVFEMLGFQYKPLEKEAMNALKEMGREDLVKKYDGFSCAKKIAYLDKVAEAKGL